MGRRWRVDGGGSFSIEAVYKPRIGFLGRPIPAGVRMTVVLLSIVWPAVSDMPTHDGPLDVDLFCSLHLLYI
jgi:hypothetical protein